VLSGRGLCDELITRPEESYRLCCVVVCDLETSRIGAPYIYIYDISSLRVNRKKTYRLNVKRDGSKRDDNLRSERLSDHYATDVLRISAQSCC